MILTIKENIQPVSLDSLFDKHIEKLGIKKRDEFENEVSILV